MAYVMDTIARGGTPQTYNLAVPTTKRKKLPNYVNVKKDINNMTTRELDRYRRELLEPQRPPTVEDTSQVQQQQTQPIQPTQQTQTATASQTATATTQPTQPTTNEEIQQAQEAVQQTAEAIGQNTINPEEYDFKNQQQEIMNSLMEQIAGGGLSEQERQNLLNARFSDIAQQQQQAVEQLQNALYSRGLGQSGVYARGLTDILNKGELLRQQAIADVQEKQLQQKQFATQMAQQLAQQRQQLQLQTGLTNAQIEKLKGDLQKAVYLNETQRQQFYDQLAQQYNLTMEQLRQAQYQFDQESKANFWSTILGTAGSIFFGPAGYLGGSLLGSLFGGGK